MEEFNKAVYKAWCEGRCGGNNHIPYENILLASLVDKNETNLAESQMRVDDDLTQQKIDNMNQNLGEKLDAIDDKLTVVNDLLQSNNELLSEIAENTKPVIVGVEITGIDGLSSDGGLHVYLKDEMRSLKGELIYSNGKRVDLQPSDFTPSKISILDETVIDIDQSGDIYALKEGQTDITYTYQSGIDTTVTVDAKMPNLTSATQTQIDLSDISVGQTIDFATDDLIGHTDMGEEIQVPKTTTDGAEWSSSAPDVLRNTEDAKFYGLKAGTSTITYKWGEFAQEFNAVVKSNIPYGALTVAAVGGTDLSVTAGQTHDGQFTLNNTDDLATLNVTIAVQDGNAASWTTLDMEEATITPGNSTTVGFHIAVPESSSGTTSVTVRFTYDENKYTDVQLDLTIGAGA